MEIFIYLIEGFLIITIWVTATRIYYKRLDRKNDEISRIKKTSMRTHSYEDHDTRYLNDEQSTISFWDANNADEDLLSKMKHSIDRLKELRMENYSVLLQYDANDKIYVASIPELPGCMAHGNTREQAIKEVEIACRLWIETAKDVGIEIPQPQFFS